MTTHTIQNIDDKTWLTHAEKNAEHRAKLFIDLVNHEKAVIAL